jgi:hypothetical protein
MQARRLEAAEQRAKRFQQGRVCSISAVSAFLCLSVTFFVSLYPQEEEPGQVLPMQGQGMEHLMVKNKADLTGSQRFVHTLHPG